MEDEQSKNLKLPAFEGGKLEILKQLLDLAQQRPDNQVWYSLEWRGDDAARIVSKLLNDHVFREESENYAGKVPMKFADFVLERIAEMIREEEAKLAELTKEAGNVSLAMSIDTMHTADSPIPTRQTPGEINRKISEALRGGGHARGRGRKNYSITHGKPRR